MSRLSETVHGLRARTVIVVSVLIAAALALGIAVTTTIVRRSLEQGVRSSIHARAQDLAAILANGTRPSSLTITDQEDVFVRISDSSGQTLAATRNARSIPDSRTFAPGHTTIVAGLSGESSDRFLVFASSVRTGNGPDVVVVGRNLDTVGETIHVLTKALVIGSGLLLLLIAGGSWLVVRRALRPVEELRATVSHVSALDLDQRVQVPRGGDEIARLAVTMNEMLARLAKAQARERRFLSDASHELRSPVAAIRQHAEVALAHGHENDGGRGLAAEVLEEGLRLEYLIDDLLALARLSEEGRPTREEPIDLDDIVLDEVKRLRSRNDLEIDARNVTAARCSADPAQMRRLVRNLIDNAARHARSAVRFELREDDGAAIFAVEDDGPGVPAQSREMVFERFARLDPARPRDRGGAGLGLAIVAGIVRVYGGSVAVNDAGLGGARFEVRLPSALLDSAGRAG